MKDSPSPPPAPDYLGAARAQGTANVETALAQGRINNPNVISPYGNQMVDWGTGAVDQNTFKAAHAAWAAGQPWTFKGVDTTREPTVADFTTQGDRPTITQTLNPQSQQIFDQQQAVRLGLAGLGQQGLGTAQNVLSNRFQFGGPDVQTSLGSIPSVQGAPNLFGLGQAGANLGAGQGIADAPNAFQFGEASGNVAAGQGMAQTPNLFGLGQAQRNVGGPQLQTSFSGVIPNAQNAIPNSIVQQLTNAQVQSGIGNRGANANIDTSGVAPIPVNAGMSGQQAIMSRLQPQIERERSQQETQLRNQGLVAGGEAYDNAMTIQNQRENDLLAQATLQGINLDFAANQQGFGQRLAQGQFGNQAVAQNFGQGLQQGQFANQATGQQFGQNLNLAQLAGGVQQAAYNQALQNAQFGNQAQLASFGANLQAAQFGNQALAQNQQTALQQQQAQNQAQNQAFGQQFGVAGLQNQAIAQNVQQALAQQAAQNAAQAQGFGQQATQQGMQNQAVAQNQQTALQQQQAQNAAALQQFSQQLAGAQFGNTAQQQALVQAMQLRGLPLNEITALMSGSQIQNPQFQGYTGANIQPAPIFNAAQQQAGWNQNIYNQQVGMQNENTSGLYGIGAAALPLIFKSDRRLKSNIERIATLESGLPVYEYDIDDHHEVGVMADEVEHVMPWAVMTHPSGFRMVNYGAL